jgi:exodeoxyribonuclease V gamma subunit
VALTIHRAERADVLAEGLAGLLAEPPEDPFERDLVVVAAAGVERWLAQTLSHRLGTAPGHEDGICAGVSFVRPLHLLTELTEKERDDPWAPRRLAWAVLDVIEQHLDEPWLAIVARHVGHGLEPGEEALRRSRRYPTAKRIAALLHGYAVQRPWMVQAWTAGDDVDGVGSPLVHEVRWQAEIWRRVHTLLDGHPSPDLRLADTAAALRQRTLDPDLPQRLSFFGHTRMPHAELDVVGALAHTRDVHLWLPHPSRSRWDDVAATTTDAPRQPARRDTVDAPDTGNTLLAACARDVTELERSLLALPGEATTVHLPAPERPPTLLGQLQADLAADRDGPADDIRTLDPLDRSVQVHACHGPARQVDVLREVVVGLLADDPTLEPRDVLVMCPDVETFAPLVEAAFGLDDVPDVDHPGHRLRVRLADRATGATNAVADVLQKVVAIAAARRTTATEVRDLLSLAPVRRRFALTDDDLEQVDEWTVQTAIRWGVDADARAAWQLGGLAQNTWRTGLERLALGVVTDGHDDPDAQDDTHTGNRLGGVLPLDDLGSTGVDLVGRFTEAVERLAAVLESSRPQPVDDWVELLTTAVQTLTDVPARDAWQREQVLRVLADLTRADTGPVARGTLTVVEVAAFLTDAFAPRPTRTSFRTGSLTVCTMVPMRSVPHRVVCLLGLDSGAFPRTPTPLGDDVLARTPLVGERDAAGEDRQLFLDAVLSATEHLVITYTGASEHTGRSLPPATPVGELLDQLARTVPTADVRSQVLVQHPLQAFDTSSFIPGALVPGSAFSFDTAAYAGARATVRPQVPEPPFLPAALPGDADPITTLDTLRDLVRHPVRSFVTGRLDVRLPYEDEPIDDSVPLGLDHLERWKVKDRVLAAVLAGVPGHDAEADERRRGLLPPGPLGDAELARVRPEVGTLFALAAPLRTDTARSVDVDVELGDGRRVIGTVAGVHPHHALRVTASTVQGRQLLEAWVDVLALAAAGQGRPAHLVGRVPSGYRKAPGVITLAAPSQDEARSVLAELLDLHAIGRTTFLPLPVKTSQAYADLARRTRPEIALAKAEREWVGSRDVPGEVADAYHRLVLGPDAPIADLVERGFEQHAATLWFPLLDRMEVDA